MSTESIGVATMLDDETLVLDLRSFDPAVQRHANARLTYSKSHPQYADIRKHVGELKPGQSVPVRPWPSNP